VEAGSGTATERRSSGIRRDCDLGSRSTRPRFQCPMLRAASGPVSDLVNVAEPNRGSGPARRERTMPTNSLHRREDGGPTPRVSPPPGTATSSLRTEVCHYEASSRAGWAAGIGYVTGSGPDDGVIRAADAALRLWPRRQATFRSVAGAPFVGGKAELGAQTLPGVGAELRRPGRPFSLSGQRLQLGSHGDQVQRLVLCGLCMADLADLDQLRTLVLDHRREPRQSSTNHDTTAAVASVVLR